MAKEKEVQWPWWTKLIGSLEREEAFKRARAMGAVDKHSRVDVDVGVLYDVKVVTKNGAEHTVRWDGVVDARYSYDQDCYRRQLVFKHDRHAVWTAGRTTTQILKKLQKSSVVIVDRWMQEKARRKERYNKEAEHEAFIKSFDDIGRARAMMVDLNYMLRKDVSVGLRLSDMTPKEFGDVITALETCAPRVVQRWRLAFDMHKEDLDNEHLPGGASSTQ